MGGSGSGRWHRWRTKDTVDGLKSLDINWLQRHGHLTPGRSSGVSWTRNGEPSGNILLRAEADQVILEYRYRRNEGEWQEVTEPVSLTWTRCNYGGARPWFLCPRVGCGRRVGKLYAGGRYFLCSHCYDLTYESRREDRKGRLLLKAQNIRRRLGGSMSMADPFPDKPRGMHWSRYRRLMLKARQAELQMWREVEQWLQASKSCVK